MSHRKSTSLFLVMLALLLAIAACRRDRNAELPTPAATASTEGLEGGEVATAEPAPGPTAEATAAATAPAVVAPVPAEAIDWPPQLIASDPLPGQEVGVDTPITVRFDQPMDQTSVESAFSIEPSVPGELSWPEPETAVFTPSESLVEGQSYEVRVAESAAALNGQTLLEPVAFSLQAAGPLTVSQVIPSDGADGVQTDAIITVVFNKPVVPLVSSGEQADLPQPLRFDPPVDGTGEWTSTSIFRFIPEPAFAGATTYSVTIDPALVDVTGSALQDAPTWQFTTLSPEVVTVVPENEAVRIAPTTPISVTFNMPMDTASVQGAINLTAGDTPVTASFEWTDENRVVVLTPAENLPLESEITLTVGAAAASANGAATLEGDHTSVFNTVPFPGVKSTQPADGEVADTWQRGFNIEFESPMNDETIDGQIVVSPDPGDVNYFINEWEEGYSVYLDFELRPDTTYTVTVPGTAADPYGNTLGEDYTFSFRSAPLPALAAANLPREFAQLSTSFPSNVQIMHRGVSSVDVALYSIGVNPELIFNSYQMSERLPAGDPIFQVSIPVENVPSELGVETVELASGGVLPTGVYQLRVSAPELDADSIYWQNRNVMLVVADTNLVVKEMFGEVRVWATDLATGQPAAGRNLTLHKRSSDETTTAVTDENGFARLDYQPAEPYLSGVAVVSNEPGAAGFGVGSTLWTDGVLPWQMGIANDSGPEQAVYAYIYTDRPIYRPGDTLYYKGIVRQTGFGRYSLPELDEMEISVNANFFLGEGSDTFSQTFTVQLDGDGVFTGELALPDDMPLGTYSFNLTGDLWLSSRSFTVAEYRTPEFQVTMTPERPEALRGEPVNVNVDATYLFGGSAGDLPVNWTAWQTQYVPVVEGPYVFGDQAQFDYVFESFPRPGGDDGLGQVAASGSGQTDAAGHFTVPLAADLLQEADPGSRKVTVESTVGGLGEFPITGRAVVIFHAGEAYVGVHPVDYIVNVGEETTVELLTVDWAGEPLANQSVEVTFYQRNWESERVVEFSTRVTRWTPVDTEVARETATTDENGKASVTFSPESGGSFLVVATVTDGAGRQQLSSSSLWSVDERFAGWRTDPNERTMELIADKSEYRVGETAQILVESPFAQPVQAWLTIERGTLIDQQVVTVNGSQILEIPITEEFAPNVHVTVAAVKPVNDDPDFPYADIRVGMIELVVPPDQFELNVTLTPGAGEYGPGDTASFDIVVTDQAGSPVQSEVSLSLVDLGVLLLKEDNAPNILEAFYYRQPLRSNLGSGLLVTAEGLEIEEPTPGGGFGGGGGGDMFAEAFRLQGEDDVRRDFKDTAYWEAKLVTDENGRASVEVPLPDNVTTWRLTGKAATSDTRVGQSSTDILARLPLIVRPVTPRFFTVGDAVMLGANVNNNTDAAIEATVTLEASGVALEGEATQTVTVPAGGRELVRWNVTVEDVPTADLTFRVEGGGFTDASKPTAGVGPDALLPVYRYDGRDFVATAGELDAGERRVEALVLPQGVDPRQGEALVKLQPSLAAAIIESFDALDQDFPVYLECASTVADRLLHNTAIEAAIGDLELDMAALSTRLSTQNTADAAKLQAFQKSDGGFGWCFSQRSDPWISAQALLALSRASRLGYEVDAAVVENAAGYLRRQLQRVDQLGDAAEANRQAFFLYVLADSGQDVTGDADELVAEHRALLDPYAKALLALAYQANDASGDNQAALLTDLNDEVIMSATGAHWETAESDFTNLSSNIRGTAMVIEALSQLQPDSPLLPPAVRWIMVARQAETWPTLHETAWSVTGLSSWMKASGELEPDYAYELRVNLQPRASGAFTPGDVTQSESVRVPVNELLGDNTNFFDFRRGDGNGRLYYTLRLDSAIAVDQLDPVSRGFTIERRYFDASCDPEAETCEPIDAITTGGRVRVELSITVANDRIYVLVEDPIPAGTDAIDPNLLTSESNRGGSIVPPQDEYARGFWGWWYFDHIQYRDDKVVFLSQFLPAGTYQYTYFLQPNVPGTYQVMPTTAREEFFPEVFGRSEGMTFSITE